jgi:amino acid adenylation domain-containing protein
MSESMADAQKEGLQGFRISPWQRRVWSLQSMDPGAPYVAQCEIAIDGGLDVENLKLAILKVIDRYEILRTCFRKLPGMLFPVQVIEERSTFSLAEEDLSLLDEREQGARLRSLFEDNRLTSFNYGGASPLNLALVRLSLTRHRLLACLPSLCADCETLNTFMRQVVNFYSNYLRSGASDAPMQYADIAEWQNGAVESEESEKGLEYWRKRHAPGLLSERFLFEGIAPDEHAFRPKTIQISIDSSLLRTIEGALPARGLPVEIFLFTCWQILLWRFNDRLDFEIGVAFDGRRYEELQEAMGLLTGYLPLQCSLKSEEKFLDLASRNRQVITEIEKWSNYFVPGQFQDAQSLDSALLHFPAVWEYADQFLSLDAGGLTFSMARQRAEFDRYKVKLRCEKKGDRIDAEISFDESVFAEGEARRLAAAYVELVKSAAESPDRRILDLDYLSEGERRQLLEVFDQTQITGSYADPDRDCIPTLFSEQAVKRPEAVAVVDEWQSLSYGELDRRSSQLAGRLAESGVAGGDVVGLMLERGVEMVVSLLGILKAGAAYLPIDQQTPVARANYMLKDGKARALITSSGLLRNAAFGSVEVVLLDQEGERIWSGDPEWKGVRVEPEQPVYVIYTSGSTGESKGVVVEHRQLARYVKAVTARAGLEGGKRYAVVTTLSADLGNTMIYPSLLLGGELHVVSVELARDGRRLGEYMEREGIDYLKVTPSHLDMVMNTSGRGKGLPLEKLIFGGEALSEELVSRVREEGGCEIYNHYGPTETTVGVIAGEVRRGGVLALGRALSEVRAYVMDERLKVTGVGLKGEICIGGAGVSRGYIGRADETAQKYVPDPYGAQAGARMYRTGDQGRVMPDGRIDFLGRLDGQVKIRGHRVEIGEIEALLKQHAEVKAALVQVQKEGNNQPRIIAYVVFHHRQSGSITEILSHLRKQAPDYMRPSIIVPLDSIPLTSNGKVDWKMLPAPDKYLSSQKQYVEPLTELQMTVAAIWRQLLQIEKVGARDNFFDLGGHSLLAAQLHSRIRDAFQINFPLSVLFDSPTVAEMAENIASIPKGGITKKAPPIHRVTRNQALPLSFAQQRLWFLDQIEPDSHVYNVPTGLPIEGDVDIPALEKSLNEIVRRHESLRTRFISVNGQPAQIIEETLSVKIKIIDLMDLPPEERETQAQRIFTDEARLPFDLSHAPLFRVTLLRLEERKQVLFLVMHHIISDRWSFDVFSDELQALWKAFAGGEPSPLPELEIQYADYACWQREWCGGEFLEPHLEYWKRQLEGAPKILRLPTDYPRPEIRTFRGETFSFSIPKTLKDEINALARRESATVFMVMMAAFKVLLWHHSNQEDIVVGTDVANRDRREIEGLIGFFVNQIVVRTDLSGDPNFRELLARVRRVALEAYSYQEIPFDRLVAALNPERESNYSPLFQAKIVMQNTQEWNASDALSPTYLKLNNKTAKFDLMLILAQKGQGIKAALEYNSDLFKESTVRRLARHYQLLLEESVRRPEMRLSELGKALSDDDGRRRKVDKAELRQSRLLKFKNIRRRTIVVTQGNDHE